jgi:Conserved protein/domain typically associated with flavoprotein oxygenases, DIM6/NTAB family
MARLPSGVVVVSARLGAGFRGLTASSLVSISAEPPMVLVGLEREAATRAAVVEGRAFNVSVLTRAQEFIAERFAGRAPAVDPAWREIPHRLGTNGIPLVEGPGWSAACWKSIRPVTTTSASARSRRPFWAPATRSSSGIALSGPSARAVMSF